MSRWMFGTQLKSPPERVFSVMRSEEKSSCKKLTRSDGSWGAYMDAKCMFSSSLVKWAVVTLPLRPVDHCMVSGKIPSEWCLIRSAVPPAAVPSSL